MDENRDVSTVHGGGGGGGEAGGGGRVRVKSHFHDEDELMYQIEAHVGKLKKQEAMCATNEFWAENTIESFDKWSIVYTNHDK